EAPLLRRPAPPRDRARARHGPASARPGRARRRHDRHREGRAAQAPGGDPQGRHDPPPHRARRAPGDGPLRPRAGPGLRTQHCRGRAARDPEGPASHRGLPRQAAREGPRVSLLALEKVEVAYGGIRAVKGIDLEVAQGEMVCLIGANGAGKSTTLRAITGLVHAAAGRIRYDGQEIGGLRVHEIARRGLAMVPEGRGVFPQLTIEENLGMGAYARRDRAAVKEDQEHAYHLFPRLHERRAQTAGTLSGGEQQMLAIARALMSRPRLLLLDEPSMGLA